MAHLSDEVETIYERLADHGVRTACTPFLIYRGRTRHELGLEGLLRRVALAATFRHATWGPDELFYGELYTSRKVPCKPTLARPDARDEYSACCGRELVENDLYDFLLFSLPDNDYHSHKFGPDAQVELDRPRRRRPRRAHRRRRRARALPRRARGDRDGRPRPDGGRAPAAAGATSSAPTGACCSRIRATRSSAELAVCPSSRAAGVYVLAGGRPRRSAARRRPRAPARARRHRPLRLARARGRAGGLPRTRRTAHRRPGPRPVVERAGARAALQARLGRSVTAAARAGTWTATRRRSPRGSTATGSCASDLPGLPGAALERAQRARTRPRS